MSGEDNSPLEIPDIDKIYASGREPTEEEWKLWASNFKPKKLRRRVGTREVQYGKETAKRLLNNKLAKRKAYKSRDKKNYQSWGSKYNAKRRYLTKYNEEWRNMKNESYAIHKYKVDSNKYDSWINKYKTGLKAKLIDYAFVYQLEENVYVYGYSLNRLIGLNPYSKNFFMKLYEENIIPPPIYKGSRIINGRRSNKVEYFYLYTEGKAFLDTVCNIKIRVGKMKTEEKKLFAKKRFWNAMKKQRELFNNERNQ